MTESSLLVLGMGELSQLTYLLLESEGGPKEILDDDLYRKNYSKINLKKLVLILEKYKNDKLEHSKATGNEELDKIMARVHVVHKNEALTTAKKLRESLNFTK